MKKLKIILLILDNLTTTKKEYLMSRGEIYILAARKELLYRIKST